MRAVLQHLRRREVAHIRVAATSAHAASGYDRCPQGRFRLLDGADGSGAMATYGASMPTLGSWDNKASSIRNMTGLHARVHSERNHVCTDAERHEVLLAGDHDTRHAGDLSHVGLSDRVSSFRPTRTSHECTSGAEYMEWSRPSDVNADGPNDLHALGGPLRTLYANDGTGKLGNEGHDYDREARETAF
ncbi:peptidase inhibitor family I36 protein [Streptomyces sp. NPDC002133]|uniref:peptidase inhibitor family I36 protein n=1 Tax=Streptomyces sp. NPDC002133 TaxID=3154409 RepID=UPI003326707E